MITSQEILTKLMEVESQNSPLFHSLDNALKKALESEAEIARIEAISKAKQAEAEIEASTKLELYTKLSKTSSPRLALASIFGTPKAVENILKEDVPINEEAQQTELAQQEFNEIIKSCNTDKPEPQYVPPDYTDLGNLMIKISKIDESLISEDIKALQDYKILEKKYLDLESKTIFKGKWPMLINVTGRAAQAAPNLGKCKTWLVDRILNKYPELKCVEAEVDERWKMLPALSEKCKELRQLDK